MSKQRKKINSFIEGDRQEQLPANEILEKMSNRKYKDSVFTLLFKDKERLLDLYQTLHPEDNLITKEDLETITLENVFMNDYYNDLGFLVNNRLIVLMEHQSTINENMPLRFLIYYVRELERYIKNFNKDIYRKHVIHLPVPEFYVVYTGDKVHPPTLKLSNAFENIISASVEVEVKVIIEEDVNNLLGGYIYFVQYADYLMKKASTDEEKIEALHKAIQHCISNGILSGFLKEREMEVVDMITEKFDFKTYVEVQIEEAVEEVTKEVTNKHILVYVKTLRQMNTTSDFIKEQLMENFNLTEEEAIKYIQ